MDDALKLSPDFLTLLTYSLMLVVPETTGNTFYIIIGILRVLLLVENRVWLLYTCIDDVIESYARSDWLKYFDEYYIKQINPIIHGCVL